MGISRQTQSVKLKGMHWATVTEVVSVAEDGGRRPASGYQRDERGRKSEQATPDHS
jgi:hypothetical protein